MKAPHSSAPKYMVNPAAAAAGQIGCAGETMQRKPRDPLTLCRGDSGMCCAGEVVVTGMSAGRIAWPTTRKGRSRPAFILCGDLANAVKQGAAIAICYWILIMASFQRVCWK
jgi:hypothetical protein